MERKTMHRLLGIVVLIGLVVLLIPLFQSDKNMPTEAAVMKAPPFPDQPVQVSAEPESHQPVLMPADQASAAPAPKDPEPAATPDPDDDMPDQASFTPPIPLQQNVDNNAEQPDDTISISHTGPANAPAMQVMPSSNKNAEKTAEKSPEAAPVKHSSVIVSEPPIKEDDIQAKIADESPSLITNKQEPVTPEPKILKTVVKTLPKKQQQVDTSLSAKMRTAALSGMPKGDNGLTEITNAGWVIQVGSYKNKTAALKMVNHLRANGYRAFIQKMSSAFGEDTRVFIGPENKQHLATAIADQLELDLHIHGIVISYKPLAL